MAETIREKMHRIAVIPGDGIGRDVIAAGIDALQTVAARNSFRLELTEYPWSCEWYAEHGTMMPDDALDLLGESDAIYLGAVGFPGVPDHISLWGLLLPIRQAFDQYVNLRPIRALEGVPFPLSNRHHRDLDIMLVRENTEGEYAGVGGRIRQGTPDEVALQTSVFTRRGVERIVRYGFEQAQAHYPGGTGPRRGLERPQNADPVRAAQTGIHARIDPGLLRPRWGGQARHHDGPGVTGAQRPGGSEPTGAQGHGGAQAVESDYR